MPPRKSPEELKPYLIRLFVADYEWLRDVYPQLGAAKAIREIIKRHRRIVEEKVNLSKTLVSEIQMEEINVNDLGLDGDGPTETDSGEH